MSKATSIDSSDVIFFRSVKVLSFFRILDFRSRFSASINLNLSRYSSSSRWIRSFTFSPLLMMFQNASPVLLMIKYAGENWFRSRASLSSLISRSRAAISSLSLRRFSSDSGFAPGSRLTAYSCMSVIAVIGNFLLCKIKIKTQLLKLK